MVKRKRQRTLPGLVVGDTKPRFWLSKKTAVLALIIVVGLMALVWGAFRLYSYQQQQAKKASQVGTACTDAASNDVLKQAANNLKPSNTKQLLPVVEKIKTLKDYTRDPNCMAVVTAYYVNIADAPKARAAYSQLVKVYQPSQSYDLTIRDKVLLPPQLKLTIEFLEQQAKKAKDGQIKGGSNSG